MSTDAIILLSWFGPALFIGRFGARAAIEWFSDDDDFLNGILGWAFSLLWPVLLPCWLVHRAYLRAPNALKYLVVARPPKKKVKKQELAELYKRTAQLEKELDLV